MNLDRFQPPDKNSELYECPGCYRKFHYERLDGNGLCEDCRPDEDGEEEDET
jgi:hypothetical protein